MNFSGTISTDARRAVGAAVQGLLVQLGGSVGTWISDLRYARLLLFIRRERLKPLSEREYEVMVMLIHGVKLHEWAKLHGFSKTYAWNLSVKAIDKLGARNITHAAVLFAQRYNYFLQSQGIKRPPSLVPATTPAIRQLRKEERNIYDAYATGLNRLEVATRLNLDERRVSNVVNRSLFKLGARTVVQAVVNYKLHYGLPSDEE